MCTYVFVSTFHSLNLVLGDQVADIEFYKKKKIKKPASNDLVNAQKVEMVTFRVRPEHRIYSAFSHAGHLTFQKCSSGQLPVNY